GVRLRIVLFDGVVLRRLGRELIPDLCLVAVLVLAGPAAEEDAAVEMLAVALALELENEVGELAVGLQIAGPVLDVDGAVDDRELRLVLLAGKGVPAAEVLAVEERLHAVWPKLE